MIDPTIRFPTGLTEVDLTTGGGRPGALWLMSGPTGTPVSLLALTAARATSLLANRCVTWVSTHESPSSLAESVIAAEARHPYGMSVDPHLELEELGVYGTDVSKPANLDPHLVQVRADRLARIEGATTSLAEARFRMIKIGPSEIVTSAMDLLMTGAMDLLVLDQVNWPDLDGADLAVLGRLAAESATWVVLVCPALADDVPRQAATYEHVEVIVVATHPDLHDSGGPYAGEAHLAVHRNHMSAARKLVAFQARYRRYVNGWVHPPYAGLAAV